MSTRRSHCTEVPPIGCRADRRGGGKNKASELLNAIARMQLTGRAPSAKDLHSLETPHTTGYDPVPGKIKPREQKLTGGDYPSAPT